MSEPSFTEKFMAQGSSHQPPPTQPPVSRIAQGNSPAPVARGHASGVRGTGVMLTIIGAMAIIFGLAVTVFPLLNAGHSAPGLVILFAGIGFATLGVATQILAQLIRIGATK